jgi:hypothetical protein
LKVVIWNKEKKRYDTILRCISTDVSPYIIVQPNTTQS